MALHILRKVNQAVIDELHVPVPQPGEPAKDFLYLDKTKPWFAQNYLDADHPRDQYSNQSIMEGTEGFALWNDGEGVVATFGSFKEAYAARASAKLSFTVKVDMPEADAEAADTSTSEDAADAVESGTAAA